MKKIHLFFLITWRFVQRYHRKTNRLFLAFSLVLLVFFVWLFVIKPSGRGTVSEGVVGIYNTNSLPSFVTNLISEPLVSFDKNNYPVPHLATWQVNNNGTVYSFRLKDNLYWHDGQVVKSSDIQFNLTDVETTYPDEKTIVFKLADSFFPFPSLLTSPILKGHTIVGIGKYKVTYQETNHDIVSKLVLSPLDNRLPIIKIRFYPDEKTAHTAFALGEVDSLIGTSSFDEYKNQSSVGLKKITNYNKLVAIFYNTHDLILSDKNLRKALSFALPQVSDENIAKTSIQPHSWAFLENSKSSINDNEAAKAYMQKVNKTSQITLTTTPALALLGETVVSSWKKIGQDAVLRIEGGIPQKFQALLTTQPIPTDPDQYALWHSTQSKTNLTGYSTTCCPASARVDKDLEDGRKTGDLEKRKEKYLDFQRVLIDDVPATFLYFPKTVVLYRKKIGQDLDQVIPLQMP